MLEPPPSRTARFTEPSSKCEVRNPVSPPGHWAKSSANHRRMGVATSVPPAGAAAAAEGREALRPGAGRVAVEEIGRLPTRLPDAEDAQPLGHQIVVGVDPECEPRVGADGAERRRGGEEPDDPRP